MESQLRRKSALIGIEIKIKRAREEKRMREKKSGKNKNKEQGTTAQIEIGKFPKIYGGQK